MYDKAYANAWISDHESGKDLHRRDFIIPLLKNEILALPKNSKLLDVGCGWGIAVEYIRKDQEYFGIDVTTDFFDYVKNKYPNKKLSLTYGALPGPFDFKDEYFDLIICSMSIHTVKDIKKSLSNLSLKLKEKGKLILIDFNNKSEGFIQPRFDGENKRGYSKGLFALDSGAKVKAEIFFHTEEEYERELAKYGNYQKKQLGLVFVSYILTKG